MMRKYIILFITLLSFFKALGQSSIENNEIILPSPTAYSFVKNIENPTNLYNGLVDISENLFSVQSGVLKINISLNYNTSGIKPSEIPGWVGLGFNLNAGGVISRIVKDLPDDAQNGYLRKYEEIEVQMNKAMPDDEFLKSIKAGQIDSKQDVFIYNFNGYNGKFVFDENGSISILNGDNLKIIYDIGYRIDQFKVIDDKGVTYTFSSSEKTFFKKGEIDDFFISTWYLSKIENRNGDRITFNYTIPGNNYRFKESPVQKMIFGVFGGESFSDYYDLPNLSRDQVVYLQEIHFKNGYLKFNTSERNDLKFIPSNSAGLIASEQKLNNIELYNFSNQLVDKIVFHYKTNESRLTLEKISKINIINGIELPVLKFTYNPIRFTSYGLYNGNAYSTNAIDHWGYYNGINNNVTRIPPVSIPEYSKNLPGADRSISEMNVKAHMLERIDYSTGGFRLFDYESNDYTPSNGQAPSKDISETYDFFYEDGIFNVEPELITFTLTEATSIEIKKGIISVGPNRNWLLGTNSETTNTVLSAGIYNLRNLFKTNLLSMPNNSDIQTAYGSVNFSKKISTTNALGPGIRIKKITFHDGINTFSKRFIYKRENSILSSGALSVTPMYHTKMSVGTGASGYILSSNWLNDQTEDSPVGYSRVEEISDNNAKVIHYFSSYNDFPDEISISLNDHDEKLSSLVSNSYLRGRKKMEVFLDSLNHIVRKQVYTYKDVLERRKDITFLDVKTLFNKVLMTNNSPVGLVVEADMTLIQKSKVKSRFMVQSSFLKTDYFGNDSLVSVSNSFYDNPLNNYPRRIETKDSQGLHEVMLTTYPLDYVNEHIFGLDSLRSSRQLSLPIERVKYIFRNLQPDIVSGQLYEYYFDSRGLVKNIHGLETSSNIPLLLFKFSNGDAGILPLSSIPSIFLQDNRYKVSKQYLNYDSYGNPLAIKKTDGPVTSYLWGYNGQYPVAEIVNAHYNDVVSAIGGQSVVDALNSGTVTEDYIRQKMDILRSNLPGSQVTSYTYKPLVGMTSKIDAKGQTEYYQYDGLQRLQHVLDQFQQLRQSYHYHYRPQ